MGSGITNSWKDGLQFTQLRGQLPRGRSWSRTRPLVLDTLETRASPPGGKTPWRRACSPLQWCCREDALEEGMQPAPVMLPEESHGERSLGGYSPWGRRVGHEWATCTHASPSEDPRAEDRGMWAPWPWAPGFQAGPWASVHASVLRSLCLLYALKGLSVRFWISK